jgi:hypothetical protein
MSTRREENIFALTAAIAAVLGPLIASILVFAVGIG